MTRVYRIRNDGYHYFYFLSGHIQHQSTMAAGRLGVYFRSLLDSPIVLLFTT